jgi:hypothetical protein
MVVPDPVVKVVMMITARERMTNQEVLIMDQEMIVLDLVIMKTRSQ